MAAAIPAAIGVGSSIVGGIKQKGQAKKQDQLAQQQMAQLQPLINQQLQSLQMAQLFGQEFLPQAQSQLNTVYNQATGQFQPLMQDYKSMLSDALTTQGKIGSVSNANLMGVLSGLGDLENDYRPFLQDGARAIEKFLPSKGVLDRLLSSEYSNINQGYQAASENIAKAPRGPGRVSSLARADLQRQQDLNTAQSQGRMNFGNMALQNFFQAGEGKRSALLGRGQTALGLGQQGISEFSAKSGVGLQQLQAALQALGIGGQAAGNLGQMGQGLLGLGAQGGGNLFDLANQGRNATLSRQLQELQNQQGQKGLGGFLVDLFQKDPVKEGIGKILGKIGIGGPPKPPK